MNIQIKNKFSEYNDDNSPRNHTKARFFCAKSSIEAFIRPLIEEYKIPVHIKDNTPNGKVYTFTAFPEAQDIPRGFCVRLSLDESGTITLTTRKRMKDTHSIEIRPESGAVGSLLFTQMLQKELQNLYPNIKHIITDALQASDMMGKYLSITP